MSKLEVENAIAGVSAQPLPAGQPGPVIGSVNAHNIFNAIEESGYTIVRKDMLANLRASATDLLKALDGAGG